jgi:hypothetical protein
MSKNLINADIFTLFYLCKASLMDCSPAQLIQACAWHYFDWNVPVLGLLCDSCDGGGFTLSICKKDALDSPSGM